MSEYENHPTQKPIALLERIIKASSKKGDTVLDPFSGTLKHMGILNILKVLNQKLLSNLFAAYLHLIGYKIACFDKPTTNF